jgi:glutamyl-tRNA synthetase
MNMLLALGRTPPVYAHLPMILGSDGSKLSKRHGAVSVLQYRDEGYLPEAVLNYLARLGWSHGDQEIFTIAEMVRLFDIVDVNKSASAFDAAKLTWLNQQHLKSAPVESLAERLRGYLALEGVEAASGDVRLAAIVLAQRERVKTLKEMAVNSVFFFRAPESYEEKAVRKHVTPEILALLPGLEAALAGAVDWSAPAIHAALSEFAVARNLTLGRLAQPIRIAVCGGGVSPPVDATLAILGRDETLARLRRAAGRWQGPA